MAGSILEKIFGGVVETISIEACDKGKILRCSVFGGHKDTVSLSSSDVDRSHGSRLRVSAVDFDDGHIVILEVEINL